MAEAWIAYDDAQKNIEVELERRWQEKVAAGTRDPRGEGETPPAVVTRYRHSRKP